MVEFFKNNRAYIAIILIYSYLLIQGLSNNYFWDDEANTALFANNIIKTGLPYAWDQRNIIAFRNGEELNNNLVNGYMPPLQYYIGALSFSIFGVSTFSGRFIFVLFDLASLIIFLLILKQEFNKKISLFAMVILSFSVSFLLFTRQARYYSLTIFFSLLAYYFYKRYVKTGAKKNLIYLVIALIFLFYSNFIMCLAFIASLIIIHFVFYFNKEKIKELFIPSIVFLLAALPYIFYAKPYSKNVVSSSPYLIDKLVLLLRNFRELNTYQWFPWMLFILLVFFLVYRKSLLEISKEIFLLIISYIFIITISSPQPVSITQFADVRYLLLLLPFISMLIALALFFLWGKSKIISIAALALLLSTNILTINPLKPELRFDLVNYLYEIHNDRTTSYEAVDLYLKQNAKQDDSILIFPEYMRVPIIFYTGSYIKVCCQLNKKTKLPIKEIELLDKDIFIENAVPDWIIAFGPYGTELSSFMINQYSKNGIEYNKDMINVYWADETYPEILFHRYKEKVDFNPEKEGIFIFKRVKI